MDEEAKQVKIPSEAADGGPGIHELSRSLFLPPFTVWRFESSAPHRSPIVAPACPLLFCSDYDRRHESCAFTPRNLFQEVGEFSDGFVHNRVPLFDKLWSDAASTVSQDGTNGCIDTIHNLDAVFWPVHSCFLTHTSVSPFSPNPPYRIDTLCSFSLPDITAATMGVAWPTILSRRAIPVLVQASVILLFSEVAYINLAIAD